MTTVTFGGITFDDEASHGFTIGKWKGWWDAPPVKRNSNDRPRGHGSFRSARNWRGERVISQEGSFVGSSMAETYAAMDQIAALQASGIPGKYRVVEPFSTKHVIAELANGPTLPDQIFSPYFTYSFDVVAADPLKYGDAATVSTGLPTAGTGIVYPITYPIDYGTPGNPGQVVTVNAGTTDAYSMFEITGGMSEGFELKETTTGKVIRFERMVPAGSTIFLNPRTGRASIDGQSDVSGFLTRSDWWTVPAAVGGVPGSRTVQFNALGVVTGTPILTAHTSAAYL